MSAATICCWKSRASTPSTAAPDAGAPPVSVRIDDWLDRRWRQFATGLSFAIFGAVGLLFGLTLFPIVCLPTRDPAIAKRRTQRIVHGWFWTFSRLMRALGVISWEIHAAELLKVPGQQSGRASWRERVCEYG